MAKQPATGSQISLRVNKTDQSFGAWHELRISLSGREFNLGVNAISEEAPRVEGERIVKEMSAVGIVVEHAGLYACCDKAPDEKVLQLANTAHVRRQFCLGEHARNWPIHDAMEDLCDEVDNLRTILAAAADLIADSGRLAEKDERSACLRTIDDALAMKKAPC